MANTCTKCGTSCRPDARFCDNCGQVLPQPPERALAAGNTTPMRPGRTRTRSALLAGAAVAALAVAGAAFTWWRLPEKASEASFTRAINDYYKANAEARDKLVCVADLPYQQPQIRIGPFARASKEWMDALAASGLYAGPQEQTSTGFLPLVQYVYDMTAAGRAAMRNQRLCMAAGLQVRKISGFDLAQDAGAKPTAVVSATLEMTEESPWLVKSPARAQILDTVRAQELSTKLRLAVADRKWQVDPDAVSSRDLSGMPPANRPQEPSGGKPATPKDRGFFDQLAGLFSPGPVHPLVGKWRGPLGTNVEFTADSISNNGVVMKATFKVKGKDVIVTPQGTGGIGIVYKMIDKDTASMEVGVMHFELKRLP